MKIQFIAKMILTLTITCLSSLTSFSADSHDESIVHQAIALRNDIEHIVDIAESNRGAHALDEGRIIILGKTGCGKTTLVCGYAVGLKSEVNEDDVIQLNPSSPLQGFEPRFGAAVGTRFPTACYDPVTNVAIWDCPGFGDPRGPKDDILNAFAIDKLFDGSPVKLILVVQDVDLDIENDRGINFFELLNQLVRYFPNEEQLQNALSLVVTKGGRPMPHARINTLLRQVLSVGAENLRLSPAAVRILDFLHRRGGRVASLPRAQQEGAYSFDRQRLVDSVKDANFVSNLEVDFKAGLKPEAKLLVVDYAQALNDYIVSYMKNEMTQKLVDHFNSQIDGSAYPALLREEFRQIKIALHNLRQVPRSSPLDVVDILSSFVDTAELRKTIEVLMFLKRIRDSISIEVGEWSLALLNNVEPMLDNLSALPQIAYDSSSRALTVSGLFVSASDIKAGLSQHGEAKHVHAFALNTLWLDEDITAQETCMNIISPQWKIVGERTIDLSGFGGCNGASGSCGYVGRPGGFGGNGGHFYGKGSVFSQLENLRVITDGGQGGRGGDGGKGYDGKDGCDGDLSKETDCQTNTKSVHTEVHCGWNYDTETTKIKRSFHDEGSLGCAGGNGYSSGCGGLGGLGGCCTVDGGVISSPPVGCRGGRGDSGYSGAGGKGGKHGRDCQGIQHTGYKTVTTHTQKYRTEYGTIGSGRGCTNTVTERRFWESETETTHLPEKWKPGKHFKKRSPSHAPDGDQGSGVNDSGLQYPKDQIPYDPSSVTQAFLRYREATANHVDMSSFIK